MKLSIIVPCYNAEGFIEQAIQSVVRQNTEEAELILVDDGSTDDTGKICKRYESDTVKYIRTENAGAGHARNVGIQNAKGEWIGFLDSDDLYLPNRLNDEFFRFLDSCKEIDVISTSRAKIDMALEGKADIFYAQELNEIQNHMPLLEFWTCIYRREFLLTHNVAFYEYRRQDIETAFRFQAFSRTDRILVKRNFIFYLQRDNLQSNTHTWNWYYLYEIKAKVYFDLYTKAKAQDKKYLLEMVVQQLHEYYRLCREQGRDRTSSLSDMHELLRSVLQAEKEIYISKEARECLKECRKADRFWRFIKFRKEEQEKAADSSKDVGTAVNDNKWCLETDVIMERLEEVEKQLQSQYD